MILQKEFETKDLGLLHYFLGLEIWQRSGGLFVSQGKYAWEILEKFNMHGYNPVDNSSSWWLEEGGCYFNGGSGCHCLSTVGGVAYVFGQYTNQHMLCC